jgi:hypothetical protein
VTNRVKRRLRWELPAQPRPKRPYRDSALFHLVLAAMIVLVAYLTGGSLRNAFVFAVAFFVIATTWSWRRWREQLREERRQRERAIPQPNREGG